MDAVYGLKTHSFLVKFEIHLLFYKHVNSKINQSKTKNIEDLEDTAHPLEAVFLWGVWPLLCHYDDPLVVQYRHRKHCDPGEQSNTVTNWLSCSTRSANFHNFRAASSFTFPCTQTSWAPRPALWQLRHQRYVSAHWRPSAHPSFPQQTQGCPGKSHKSSCGYTHNTWAPGAKKSECLKRFTDVL